MEHIDWKSTQINTILGMPKLDSSYLPFHVILTLKTRLSDIPEIGAVVLFGSIIKGDASSKSDIDIMIIPMKDIDILSTNDKVTSILRSIETEYDLQVSFSPIIFTGEEDSYFLWEVTNDGVVLFVRPELIISPTSNLSPYALISYSFSGLDDQSKKKTQRFLFESKNGVMINKKNKMIYIAPGVILVSIEKSKDIIAFFDANNVNYTLAKLWR